MSQTTFIKTFGPGLLFASAAIGTSHLILATQGGAHFGLQMGWIILIALAIKYPFFEYGPRYAIATGESLLSAYLKQGRWALMSFLIIIACTMFTVVGAVGAASAGLLQTIMKWHGVDMRMLTAVFFLATAVMLIVGRFKLLDIFIKGISLALFVAVLTAFVAVIIKGPVDKVINFSPSPLMGDEGLLIIIGILGWMPVGLEASAFSSLWTIKKMETTGYRPTLKESLLDFNMGYGLTSLLAFLFLVIGAFTVYGTGIKIAGSPVIFSEKLIQVFTNHIGKWSSSFIAIGAFGAIYGTLITAWDAFARSIGQCLVTLRKGHYKQTRPNDSILSEYSVWVVIIGIGGFLVISALGHSLGLLLNVATALSFLFAPLIAFLNLRAVINLEDVSSRPPKVMVMVSVAGIVVMAVFAVYYLWRICF